MDADLEDVLSDEEQLEPVAQAVPDVDEDDVEAELFGDDDEELPTAPIPVPAAAPAPSPQANASADKEERKKALSLLAAKRAAAEDGGKASKKSKKDKGSGRGGEREGGGRKGGSSRRQRGGGEEAGGGEEGGVEVGLLGDEVENMELVATAEDQEFIDDEGAPEEEGYGSEEEDETERLRRVEQAQEDGEEEAEEGTLAAVLAARRRRKQEDDVDRRVDELIGMLNASADADEECLAARPRKPALAKMQQLPTVESTLRQVKYREPFIYGNGLSALNRWLVPYEDGTCPALKVRSTVLRLLAQLPIDASQEGIQDVLASSGVGKSVAFYSKKNDEPSDNRKLAQSMYQKWAGAMLYSREAEHAKRERRQQEHKARLAADREVRQQREAEERKAAQQRLTATRNDPHYRPRAAVPSAGKMDYVVNPAAKAQGGGSDGEEEAPRPSPVRRTGGPAGNNSLAQFEKKKKAASQRAARHDKVSVEGRGMSLRG